jgi:hypothetical protein
LNVRLKHRQIILLTLNWFRALKHSHRIGYPHAECTCSNRSSQRCRLRLRFARELTCRLVLATTLLNWVWRLRRIVKLSIFLKWWRRIVKLSITVAIWGLKVRRMSFFSRFNSSFRWALRLPRGHFPCT